MPGRYDKIEEADQMFNSYAMARWLQNDLIQVMKGSAKCKDVSYRGSFYLYHKTTPKQHAAYIDDISSNNSLDVVLCGKHSQRFSNNKPTRNELSQSTSVFTSPNQMLDYRPPARGKLNLYAFASHTGHYIHWVCCAVDLRSENGVIEWFDPASGIDEGTAAGYDFKDKNKIRTLFRNWLSDNEYGVRYSTVRNEETPQRFSAMNEKVARSDRWCRVWTTMFIDACFQGVDREFRNLAFATHGMKVVKAWASVRYKEADAATWSALQKEHRFGLANIVDPVTESRILKVPKVKGSVWKFILDKFRRK